MKNTKEHYEKRMKELEDDLYGLMGQVMNDKSEMDKLTAHYRIGGLYSYSLYNSFLIYMQGGTIAQSFTGWKKLKRFVKKGEHSKISIFVPWFKKVEEIDRITGKKVEKKKLIKFGIGHVFNIDQTDGEELKYDHNSTDQIKYDYETIKEKMAKQFNVEITEAHTGSARGYTDGKKIVISKMSNNTDKVKTLIHEIAHVALDHVSKKEDRAVGELEAEGATYIVQSFLGMEFDLSEAYIKNWNTTGRKANIKRTIGTADKIIKVFKPEAVKK